MKTKVLHKLNCKEESKAPLDQLRDLCKEERLAKDEKAQAFLAEAENLICGKKQ